MNLEPLLAYVSKMVSVDPEEFKTVAAHVQQIDLSKNEIWEAEGKISRNLGFVNKGLLRQYIVKDGIEYTTNFYMENDFVGDYISYQTQKPSELNTMALEECELLIIPYATYESFYDKIPATKKTAEAVSEGKIIEIQKRNAALLTLSPEERYYQLLDEKPDLLNRVPQYLIAQYLGIRPESLSRIRKRHGS